MNAPADLLGPRLADLASAGRHRADPRPGLGEIALALTEDDPDRVVVSDSTRSLTRAEMVAIARRLGGALAARGIMPGAAIAFQLPNWWEATVVNMAAALFGYRIVPLLPIYRSAELGAILPACGVAAIFIPGADARVDYPAMVAGLETPPNLIVTVRGDPGAAAAFERLLDHPPGEPVLPAPTDAKMIIFTSGSTGTPKGVIHTHASMDAVVRRTAEFWTLGETDVMYVPSPIGHIGGSIYAFEFPWITGCRTVLDDIWNPDRAVSRILAEGATFMAGATPFLRGLLDAAAARGTSLPGLRRFICGGASVPPELIHRALDALPGTIVSRAYGSTEVPLACPGVRNREEAKAHADTDGRMALDLQILDAAGRPAAEGEDGEIAVRGPQMFIGYLDPGHEAGCFTDDGHFLMGDRGRIVDGDYIVVTGRTKDIIIRKGENISPLEIENALLRHPDIAHIAIVGAPDTERGEIAVAFVVPEPGATVTLASMSAFLEAAGFARQKFPERLEIFHSLPTNTVGKVQKPELRRIAAGLAAGDAVRNGGPH